MTTTLFFKTKEYKDFLKTFNKFSSYSSFQRPVITINTDPIELTMLTDQAMITAKPPIDQASVIPPVSNYSFDPTVLLTIPVSGDQVGLAWDSPQSPLQLNNEDRFNMQLNVAVEPPEYNMVPDKIKTFDVPIGILVAINKFLTMPYTYNETKDKDTYSITLSKNDEGCLTAQTDDGMFLSRVDTMYKVDLEEDFTVGIPKYMFDCLFSKLNIKDETKVKIGIENNRIYFTNGVTQVFTPGTNDERSTYKQFMESFRPNISLDFIPKTLSEAVKPLVSIIPKKDRSGIILYLRMKDDTVSLDINHSQIGNGSVPRLDDISNIYYENSENTAVIPLHPEAFYEYTNTFAVEKGVMSADSRRIHYKGEIEAGGELIKVEYIFVTVEV